MNLTGRLWFEFVKIALCQPQCILMVRWPSDLVEQFGHFRFCHNLQFRFKLLCWRAIHRCLCIVATSSMVSSEPAYSKISEPAKVVRLLLLTSVRRQICSQVGIQDNSAAWNQKAKWGYCWYTRHCVLFIFILWLSEFRANFRHVPLVIWLTLGIQICSLTDECT